VIFLFCFGLVWVLQIVAYQVREYIPSTIAKSELLYFLAEYSNRLSALGPEFEINRANEFLLNFLSSELRIELDDQEEDSSNDNSFARLMANSGPSSFNRYEYSNVTTTTTTTENKSRHTKDLFIRREMQRNEVNFTISENILRAFDVRLVYFTTSNCSNMILV
jgi:hypothetical protein